jgi:hypothetical protein
MPGSPVQKASIVQQFVHAFYMQKNGLFSIVGQFTVKGNNILVF